MGIRPTLWIPAYAGMTVRVAVILALRQYPQGGEDNDAQPYPLSLDGRGIKGEGENDAPASFQSFKSPIILILKTSTPPCGYCLKASMTAALSLDLSCFHPRHTAAPLDCGSSPQ